MLQSHLCFSRHPLTSQCLRGRMTLLLSNKFDDAILATGDCFVTKELFASDILAINIITL